MNAIKKRRSIAEAYFLPTPQRRYTRGAPARTCIQCKEPCKDTLCASCYSKSPAGRQESRLYARIKRYQAAGAGTQCVTCVHWAHTGTCELAFPEAGSVYADACPAYAHK